VLEPDSTPWKDVVLPMDHTSPQLLLRDIALNAFFSIRTGGPHMLAHMYPFSCGDAMYSKSKRRMTKTKLTSHSSTESVGSGSSSSSSSSLHGFTSSASSTPRHLGIASKSACGRRKAMEDMTSTHTIHGMQYAGVFDGHGGTEVATECLKLGPKVRDLLDAGYTNHATALKRALESVDANHAYIGSTATVALVSNDMVTVANVGDSMAYLLRGQKTIALTQAHKPTNESERARVFALGGHITKGRVQGILAMTRALGDCALRPFVSCEPEVREIARSHEDRALVLATDGLWDVLSPMEVMAVVDRVLLSNNCANACASACANGCANASACVNRCANANERASACATLLVSLALERQTMDNVSVVVLML